MKHRWMAPGGLIVFLVTSIALAASTGHAQSIPPIVINEVLVGNASTNLEPDFTNYSSWIEIRNNGGSAVKLAKYKLSSLRDGASHPDVYMLPVGISIPGNGYLLLWADEEDTGSHAQFELDMDGGELSLLMPDNTVIDSISFTDQEPDVSLGRAPDGGADWALYDRPTPGAANSTTPFLAYDFAADPIFSLLGGIYTGPQTVELSSADLGATIRYTTDGSQPTASSPL